MAKQLSVLSGSGVIEKVSAKLDCIMRMARTSAHSAPSASTAAPDSVDGQANGSLPAASRRSEFDIFISYQHTDERTMLRLKDVLERNGFTVGVANPLDNMEGRFVGKVEDVICNCKLFLCLATESTSQFRCCVDELCLAYVRKMPIYIVSMRPRAEVYAHFQTSIKLIMSRSDWTVINEDVFQNDVEGLLVCKLRDRLRLDSGAELNGEK